MNTIWPHHPNWKKFQWAKFCHRKQFPNLNLIQMSEIKNKKLSNSYTIPTKRKFDNKQSSVVSGELNQSCLWKKTELQWTQNERHFNCESEKPLHPQIKVTSVVPTANQRTIISLNCGETYQNPSQVNLTQEHWKLKKTP